MPQVSISESLFQEIDVYTQKYNVRYRLISDNKNNFSYWSPIYEVDPEIIFQRGTLEIPGYMYLEKVGLTFVGVTWDSVSRYKVVSEEFSYLSTVEMYDLWIRWAGTAGVNPSDWIYVERTSSTSTNINIPSQYIDATGTTRNSIKYMYAEVYRPGRPIIRYEQVYEFVQSITTVDTTNDYINFGRGHGYSTGTPELYLSSTPIGGLTNNTTYYTRTIDYTTIALFPTVQDSLDNTNKISLTGTPTGTGSFTGFPLRMYDALITTL